MLSELPSADPGVSCSALFGVDDEQDELDLDKAASEGENRK